MKVPYIAAIAAVAFMLLAALWKIDSVENSLLLEKTAHTSTLKDLAAAGSRIQSLEAAYEKALEAAYAQSNATQACLDREVEAQEAARERAAIIQAATPRPRTATEQQQVVDDATRMRSADRLNRPL